MTITNDELREIEARANTATPGPWTVAEWKGICVDVWMIENTAEHTVFDCSFADNEGGGAPPSEEDTKFIIHAREDIPTLLSEVRRLREELAEYQQRERLACGHG